MKLAPTTEWPMLARSHPKDVGEHASSLMKEFEVVNMWLKEDHEEFSNSCTKRFRKLLALGIKQGVDRGLEDVSQGIRKEVDEKYVQELVDREITKGLLKGFPKGVPTILFNQLYESYKDLTTKMAAKDGPAGCYNPRIHQRLPKRLPRARTSPYSNRNVSEKPFRHDGEDALRSDDRETRGWRKEPCDNPEASSELSEDQSEEAFDKCCVCGTPASDEEVITTTCCSKFVGALCFKDALDDTDRCCLCHRTQTHFQTQNPNVYSERDSDYKYHFVEDQKLTENKLNAMDTGIADSSETLIACPSGEESPPSLTSRPSAKPANALRATNQWAARTLEPCKRQDNPAEGKGILSKPSIESSQESRQTFTHGEVQRLNPQENGPEGSFTTEECVLRLFDQAVISYLKDLSWRDLLATVHEALEERLAPIIQTATFFRVLLLESGDVQIRSGMDTRRILNLEGDTASWAETLENAVRARLETYTVAIRNLEIKTMDLSDEVQRARVIEELVGYNASAMQSLSRPDDVRFIRWSKKDKNFDDAKKSSMIMGAATAAQANEIITRGLLWKGERLYCVKQGPERQLLQCDGCQAFGHIAQQCSSAPRCQACAGGHQTEDCPGHAGNLKNLRCALCGRRHHARAYNCPVRISEVGRLRLENRLYPEIFTTAVSKEAIQLAKLSSHLSNRDLHSKVGKSTPVVEQRPPSATFDV